MNEEEGKKRKITEKEGKEGKYKKQSNGMMR